MNLTLEELVNRIVAEVLAELARRGIRVDSTSAPKSPAHPSTPSSPSVHVVDMSEFRGPVLLERHLLSLRPEIREVVVPAGTVVTPGARAMLRLKNLTLKINPTTN